MTSLTQFDFHCCVALNSLSRSLGYKVYIDPFGRPIVRPVVITIFTHVVHPSAKQNNVQVILVIAAGRTMGLAKGIIDETCLVVYVFAKYKCICEY